MGVVGVEFLAFPLTWHIAYTTACCYHTSRDLGTEIEAFVHNGMCVSEVCELQSANADPRTDADPVP